MKLGLVNSEQQELVPKIQGQILDGSTTKVDSIRSSANAFDYL
jgi:hypothetical protein